MDIIREKRFPQDIKYKSTHIILDSVNYDVNLQCVGLQPNSDPPTWVIGSNLHVNLVGGVATRVPESLSPYAVLGSELAPLPIIDVKGRRNY